MVRCVWALVDPLLLEQIIATTEPLVRNWLFSMMEVLSHEELTRLTVTMWAIWTARRKLIHEGIHQSPLSTHLFVTRFIAELDQLKENSQQAATGRVQRRNSWLPPPQGFVKINAMQVSP